MKKIVLLVMFFSLLISGASAYQVYIYAPDTLTVGEPLVVNGTTTFGIGTPIDVVLYQQVTTSTKSSASLPMCSLIKPSAWFLTRHSSLSGCTRWKYRREARGTRLPCDR